MADRRIGFGELVFLFLWRQPAVWIGGVAGAVVGLVIASGWGRVAGVVAMGVVLTAAGFVTVTLDRRRALGRRLFLRGRRLSPRRFVALVLALGLVASVTFVVSKSMVHTMRTVATDTVRSQSTPNLKRGWY